MKKVRRCKILKITHINYSGEKRKLKFQFLFLYKITQKNPTTIQNWQDVETPVIRGKIIVLNAFIGKE